MHLEKLVPAPTITCVEGPTFKGPGARLRGAGGAHALFNGHPGGGKNKKVALANFLKILLASPYGVAAGLSPFDQGGTVTAPSSLRHPSRRDVAKDWFSMPVAWL